MNEDPISSEPPYPVSILSQASLPGRIVLDLAVYKRCYPFSDLQRARTGLLGVVLVAGLVTILFKWGFVAPVGLLVMAAIAVLCFVKFNMFYKLIGQGLYNGCANGAVVVSDSPFLVAVYADLDNGTAGAWPVIKVIRAPLDCVVGQRFKVGDRIPTVSTYDGSTSKPHWDDFTPVPAHCASSDQTQIARLMDELNTEPGEWESLDRYLPHVPKPYKPGLYPMNGK